MTIIPVRVKLILLFLFFFFSFKELIYAGYSINMTINPSSNMLMRPKGKSGIIASLSGKAFFSHGKADFSFGINSGVIEHYKGLQFLRQTLEISYLLYSNENFSLNTVAEGIVSKYGSVTSLSGYKHLRFSSNIKSYITESTLVRWTGTVGRRSFKSYTRESYSEASTIFRIDRFFATGTTLRGQFDTGIRSYYHQTSEPHISLLGLSVRIAQSLTPGWGMMVESFGRKAHTSSLQDSSQIFDRVFLDDIYKYSLTGIAAATTVLINQRNNIQFNVLFMRRKYGNSQTSYFPYLPPEGWKENEITASITVTYRPYFLTEKMHPTLKIYHTNVDAAEEKFSFDSSGVTLKIELY